MTLKSRLFSGDTKLEAAAVSNPGHIVPGARGDHVRKLQGALIILDGAAIAPAETGSAFYGPSTAQAVLDFKTKRQVINRSYQTKPDNIVGIMTMKALDDEMLALESNPQPPPLRHGCPRPPSAAPEPRQITVAAFLEGAPVGRV